MNIVKVVKEIFTKDPKPEKDDYAKKPEYYGTKPTNVTVYDATKYKDFKSQDNKKQTSGTTGAPQVPMCNGEQDWDTPVIPNVTIPPATVPKSETSFTTPTKDGKKDGGGTKKEPVYFGYDSNKAGKNAPNTFFKKADPVYPKIKTIFFAFNLDEFEGLPKEDKVKYLINAFGIPSDRTTNELYYIYGFDMAANRVFHIKNRIGVDGLIKQFTEFGASMSTTNYLYDAIVKLKSRYDQLMLDKFVVDKGQKYSLDGDSEIVFLCSLYDEGSKATLKEASKAISSLRKIAPTKYICASEKDLPIAASLGFREVISLNRDFG